MWRRISVNIQVKGVLVVSDTDLAWAAGLFDGEGSTSVLKAQRDKYAYVRMSVSQKFTEVLKRFQTAVDTGKIYKANTRDIHSLDIYKEENVISTLNKLWPYLSEIKKNQALKAFEKVDNNNNRM